MRDANRRAMWREGEPIAESRRICGTWSRTGRVLPRREEVGRPPLGSFAFPRSQEKKRFLWSEKWEDWYCFRRKVSSVGSVPRNCPLCHTRDGFGALLTPPARRAPRSSPAASQNTGTYFLSFLRKRFPLTPFDSYPAFLRLLFLFKLS